MTERIPIRGCDSLQDKRRRLEKKHGRENVTWEENPHYVGPVSITDQRGFEDTRGWLIVEEAKP